MQIKPHSFHVNALARLSVWLKTLVRASQINMPLSDTFVEVRKAIGGVTRAVAKAHVDRGGVVVIIAMQGAGSEIIGLAPKDMPIENYHRRDWDLSNSQFQPFIVPTGFGIIFFGSSVGPRGKFAPLIHRTPEKIDDRLLAIFRF